MWVEGIADTEERLGWVGEYVSLTCGMNGILLLRFGLECMVSTFSNAFSFVLSTLCTCYPTKGNQNFGHPTTPIAELTTLTQARPITLAQMS